MTAALTRSTALALLLAVPLLTGCGSTFGGDCSGGQADDGGYCISDHHAPARVEAAAAARFRSEGQQVDRVSCYAAREFHRLHRRFTVWGCVRVADGDAKENDELVCLPSSNGRPITTAVRSELPAELISCDAP